MSEGWGTLDGGEPLAEEAQPVLHQPTGLRQAREATGLHIAALAAALKVPVKKLEALEAGRYEELPDLTFARALASSACRQLKVDPAPILEFIPHANARGLGAISASVNTPFKPDQSGGALAPGAGRFKSPAFRITGLILLSALGLALLPDWKQWPGDNLIEKSGAWVASLSSPDTGMSETEIVAPMVAESLAMSTDEAGGVIEVVPQTSEIPVVAETSPTPLKNASPSGAEPKDAASGSILHLEATNESWVEVLDGAGKVQIQRVMRKGDVLDFSSSPPYSVVLGRADAVVVQVRGQAFDVAPFARNSVARFQVK